MITYEYKIYEDLKVENGGHLTLDKRTHACFTYYLLCQKLLEKAGDSIDDQITYEGELWMDKPYGNIAKGVALQYGLDSPDDFLREGIKHIVEQQIAQLDFPAPKGEYWNVTPGKVLLV